MRSRRIQRVMMAFLIMLMVVFVKSDVMAATSVFSSRATVSMIVGKKKQLKPKGAKGKIVWKTSKKTIATVSSKGLVTAKKKGVAVITATTKSKKWTYKVIVKESPVINKKNVTLKVGQNYVLKVAGASSRPVWKNSNTSVLTLKKQSTYAYKLIGKKKGTSTITVRVAGKTLKCKVTVSESAVTNHTRIEVWKKDITLKLNEWAFNNVITPYPKDYPNVKFDNSNPAIAKIEPKITMGYLGFYITGLKAGKTTITVTLNGVSSSCKVTVIAPNISTEVSGYTRYDIGASSKTITPFATVTIKINNTDKKKVYIRAIEATWNEEKNELTGVKIEESSASLKTLTFNGMKEFSQLGVIEGGKGYFELSPGENIITGEISSEGDGLCAYEKLTKIRFTIATYDGSKFETWPYEINLKEQ